MAYNKAKLLEAAQKFLQVGKTAQAIAEFQSILKHEPKDQVTLMTVGDLFVRQGETFQALEYFERLAQLFLADGFVAKAIAIYKKIAKLAPEETRPVERLADLYVQQGVLSEARPIYLRLAELHQRAGRHPQAAALLRKLLDAEPDNIRVQTRLAELCKAMGQPADAAAAYRNAAEQLHRRGDHAEALKFADHAVEANPGDASAVLLKARLLAESGQQTAALTLLEALPEIEHGGEVAAYLLDLYLEKGDLAPAAELATKLYGHNSRHYKEAHRVAAAYLNAEKAERAMPLLDLVRETLTDAGEHEALSQALVQVTEQLPSRIEPREWLVSLYKRTSNSFRLSDALSNLAGAYEAAGQHDRARQVYEQQLDSNPEDEAARRKYEKVKARLADGGALPEPSEPVPVPAEQATSEVGGDSQEPPLDEETQQFVTQSLTDVDLFSSYGLTQKAIDLLEVVLQRAPRHAAATERLLDLYLGAGNERRTAQLALELEQIYTERNNSTQAERFAELHRRFERAAASVVAPPEEPPAAPAAPQFAVPADETEVFQDVHEVSIAGVPTNGNEPSVHEVDLSEEWAALSTDLDGATAHELMESAQDTTAVAEAALLPEIVASTALAAAPAMPIAATPVETREIPLPVVETPAPAAEAAGTSSAAVSATAGLSADDFLQSLSSDLAASFPTHKVQEQAARANGSQPLPVSTPAAPPAAAPSAPPELNQLSEVFEQFRSELDELSKEDEDPETHYNLGIAYREMGLLEESISEFQKVAKVGNKGPAFRYAMQCCTLLGLAFMEKGEPSIAAMWYERALTTPGLDQESTLALRYDLGVAQELAGETSAARKSFSQVYGMNIDYRDVAERLAALGKGT